MAPRKQRTVLLKIKNDEDGDVVSIASASASAVAKASMVLVPASSVPIVENQKQVKLGSHIITTSSLTKDLSSAIGITTSKSCWWCRHTFGTMPLGCPLKYNKENEAYFRKMKESNTETALEDSNYFECEGIFCSFECVKAYIIEQIKLTPDGTYHQSLSLLTMMNKLINGDDAKIISPAGSWKLLNSYGGHLSIEEFRESSTIYKPTPNLRRGVLFPLGTVFES